MHVRPDLFFHTKVTLYESHVTFSPKIILYNAAVIAVWANDIGQLQIFNRY